MIEDTVSGVSVAFGPPNGRRGFCDLTIAARTGDITVIVGESGSGKTTLLNLLAGFYAPARHRAFRDWLWPVARRALATYTGEMCVTIDGERAPCDTFVQYMPQDLWLIEF